MIRPGNVAAIVLNYRTCDETLKCVESLRSLEERCRVIVVDNGSDDGSSERLEADLDSSTELICNRENLGYAGGNNVGIAHALSTGADAAWILNSDTTVGTEALRAQLPLLDCADVGAVVPYIYVSTPDDQLWYAGGHVDLVKMRVTHWGYLGRVGIPPVGTPVTFATGCSVLIPKSTFDRVGLFDERFFLYWEDVEFSRRMTDAGLKIIVAPLARVTHDVGASSRLGRGPSPTYYYYSTRNRIWLSREWQRNRTALVAIGGSAVWAESKQIARGTSRAPKFRWLIRGIWDGYADPIPQAATARSARELPPTHKKMPRIAAGPGARSARSSQTPRRRRHARPLSVAEAMRPVFHWYSSRSRRWKARLVRRAISQLDAQTVVIVGAGGASAGREGHIERVLQESATVVGLCDLYPPAGDGPKVVADGRALPFRSGAVDLAFSNAVVEHVGDERDQRAFLEEQRRIARWVFITTPNRWFPVESHTLAVFRHWSPSWRSSRGEFTRLLSRREFKHLLPSDAEFHGSRVSGTFVALTRGADAT